MSDYGALRAEFADFMRGSRMTVNELYNQLVLTDSTLRAKVSRALFYRWFRTDDPEPPGARLLECVAAFAIVAARANDVTASRAETDLLRLAGLLPEQLDHALVLADAARKMTANVRAVNRAVRAFNVPGGAEGIVIDRLLSKALDYQIRVWPVIRGERHPMHLRSWIALKPIQPDRDRQRPATSYYESMSIRARQDAIREEVITDSLWRSLGLRWRTIRPKEWARDDDSLLRIELPVDEKNHTPKASAWDFEPSSSVRRMLALSGIWGHVEPLVAVLGDALDWGTYDVRYQGQHSDDVDDRVDFAERKLAESAPHYVWGLAEPADLYARVESSLTINAAKLHLIILVTYGPKVIAEAASNWRISHKAVRASQQAAISAATDINKNSPIIHVNYADDDLLVDCRVSVDQFIDHVLYSAAQILLLLRRIDGPEVAEWSGRSFEALRSGRNDIVLPTRASTVRWCEPNEIRRPR